MMPCVWQVVVEVVPGGPAAESGQVLPGDMLEEVDGYTAPPGGFSPRLPAHAPVPVTVLLYLFG